MIYSSGKHDKLTADPWPIQAYWPDGGKGGRYAYPFTFQDVREFRREPRPEFDRPLTNPANPILSAFREDMLNARMGQAENQRDDYEWLTGPDWENYWQEHVTAEHVEHVEHVRRVLERLANLAINE